MTDPVAAVPHNTADIQNSILNAVFGDGVLTADDLEKIGENTPIVGFDNGCGIDSAAVISPDGTARMLQLPDDGTEGVYALIAYEKEKNLQGEEREYIYIGAAANQKPHMTANFKRPPTAANLKITEPVSGKTYGELLKDFIRTLFEQYRAQESNALELSDAVVCIGVPSGGDWNDPAARKNLRDLTRKAIGCRWVVVCPESRAAMYYAMRRAAKNGQSLRGKKILIIDLGAYSADITYLNPGNSHFDMTCELGGHLVDDRLFEIVMRMQNVQDCPRTKEEISKAKWNLRLAKEELYIKLQKNTPDPAVKVVWTTENGKTAATHEAMLHVRDLEDALGQGAVAVYDPATGQNVSKSWSDHLDAFLGRALTGAAALGGIDEILITGGAANMTHAVDAIRSKALAFGVRDEQIGVFSANAYTDSSVAVGCASFVSLAVKAVRSVEEMKSGVADLIREDWVNPFSKEAGENIRRYLLRQTEALPEALAKALKGSSCFLPVLQDWMQDKEERKSLNDLRKAYADACKKDPNEKNNIDEIVRFVAGQHSMLRFSLNGGFRKYFSVDNPAVTQVSDFSAAQLGLASEVSVDTIASALINKSGYEGPWFAPHAKKAAAKAGKAFDESFPLPQKLRKNFYNAITIWSRDARLDLPIRDNIRECFHPQAEAAACAAFGIAGTGKHTVADQIVECILCE